MRKQTIIAILAVIFAAMAMPQNAVAKEKKVKYLGHQYQGEVEGKVPSGKGVINVGGLIIEGVFNSNSVTDAVVYKSEYVGRPNRKFIGLVSFDESNDVTLKSNGTIISVVYAEINKFDQINLSRNAEINKFEEIKETIESDCIVNYDNFERKGVKIKSKYNQISHNLSKPNKAK